MIQTILCAVDVNRVKDEVKVLQTAARLAAAEGAQLDVITVLPDYGMSWVGGYFDEQHTKDARDKVKQALHEVRHLVAVGTAYHEILETAKKDGADLIVLGAHRPDLKDYLLGPNAARVVRHSKCSVFVVR